MSDTSTSQQEFLNRLSELMDANLGNEHFGVSELAREMGMSRSNLHRKVNSILNISASQYIREFRLNKAKELLNESSLTVSEISYMVGFGSISYFIKCFREQFGYTPGDKENHEEVSENPKKHNRWKRLGKLDKSDAIVWSIIFIFMANIFYINFWPEINSLQKQEKTIAVLPFRNNSPDSTNAYINGIMEAILNNLSNIEDLEVRSRTSVEPYRENDMSLSEIAKKLGVNYIVEGSGQKNGNEILLSINLLDAKSDKSIYSENYRRVIQEVKDYFDLQADIAIDVSAAIQTRLTPQEKQQMDKIPTENLAAYNQYLKGDEYLKISLLNEALFNNEENVINYKNAYKSYKKSIEFDSTFADPYVKLSHMYINIFYYSTKSIELQQVYLDSGYVMANNALKYAKLRSWKTDNNMAWAKNLLASYYFNSGNKEKALEIYNDLDRYRKGFLYGEFTEQYHNWAMRYNLFENYHEMIENSLKYLKYKPDIIPVNSYFYREMFHGFDKTGFDQSAKKYLAELLKIIDDSITYYYYLSNLETHSGNYETAGVLINRAYMINTKDLNSKFYMLNNAFWRENYTDALLFQNDILSDLTKNKSFLFIEDFYSRAIYIFQQNNKMQDAKRLAEKAIIYYKKQIDYNTRAAQRKYSHLRLAYIYVVLNDKIQALEYLTEIKNRETIPRWLLHELVELPLLDNIRNEPQFAEVLKDVESKYLKEHEKVGELLREFGEIE